MQSWLASHHLFTRKVLSKLLIGSFLDFSPPLVFIVAFELSDFFTATAWFMVTTVFMSCIAFFIEKRVPYFSFYISSVTLLFGWSTLFFHDAHYIQMRDTFYDLVLAVTLLLGYMQGKLLFKSAFSHSIKMADSAWKRVTQAWIAFFLIGASSNEVARRILDEEHWLYFKLMFLLLTIVFGLWVLFYFYKPVEEKE